MIKKIIVSVAVALLGLVFLPISVAWAASASPATGGGAISADMVGGAFTTLSGPIIAETKSGDIKRGTIIRGVCV